MSFEYFTKWWIVSKQHLESLYATDAEFRKKGKPINDRYLANELIGGLYTKYCLLVQELDACLDQMAQPQKRITIRKLVDAAVQRLFELNDEMKKIDISEYHYVDGTLMELKLVPYDIEILHPALMFPRPLAIEDMWKKIQKGEAIYVPAEQKREDSQEQILAENIETKIRKKTLMNITEVVKKLTPEELEAIAQKQRFEDTVKMIQQAERGRQERMYFIVKKQLFDEKKKINQMILSGMKLPQEDKDAVAKATQKIQSWWRGCSARQMSKINEVTRRMLIGMYEPSWRSKYEFEKFQKNLEKRREYRDQRVREYIEGINKEEARILRVVGPGLMEDVGDEIREWFRVWYAEAKTFDKFPPEKKGGTILVVRGETLTPKEYLDEYERKRREKVKNKGVDKQKEKEKNDKLKKEAEEKKKKEAEKKKKAEEAKKKKKKKKPGDYEFEYKETSMVVPYEAGMKEHADVWDHRNDFENPLEKYYIDIVTEQKCYENQLEMRKLVDDMMRIELEFLKEALEADKLRLKGKKGKKGGKKKPKGGKKKGKKGKGKKKDPTGDRSTEQLFQELYDNGIIKRYEHTALDAYKGDFSYNSWEFRNKDFDPPATLLDVRQAVVLNCILPLGVETMKRPKSVLIAGPRQSGKHLLANAIFTATRCVLFDLSPEVTAGKYAGAAGLKMLYHLVNKMSRLLAPSIIFFDGAEKIFYKKVPKDEKEFDPKRLGKKLFKEVIKPIKLQDRVMVLGITNKPWAAQGSKLKKHFERNILIPRPDYGSVYMYWRELLMAYHGVDRNFNVTALTKVTVNYPLPVLRKVLMNVLTPRRIIQLHYNPLTPQEVYEEFVSNKIEPITDKEYKKFLKWYKKTPVGKERSKFNKFAEGKRAAEAKANEKKKK